MSVPPPAVIFRRGDLVRVWPLGMRNRAVPAVVELASGNGISLVLRLSQRPRWFAMPDLLLCWQGGSYRELLLPDTERFEVARECPN